MVTGSALLVDFLTEYVGPAILSSLVLFKCIVECGVVGKRNPLSLEHHVVFI